jgi:phospholipase A1/A2
VTALVFLRALGAGLALGAGAVCAQISEPPRTPLEVRWDLDADRPNDEFFPRAYKPVYLLPAAHTDRLNRRPSSPAPDRSATEDQLLRHVEAKYQLSFKSKFAHDIAGTPIALWGGYTQSSRWQVYNGAVSRPFRETNYEPELIALVPLNRPLLGGSLRMLSLSLNHQSNGRSLPLSRSWNRWIATAAWEKGPWIVELRPWWRLKESAAEDDNPDILDHIGRGEMIISRYWGEGNRAHALILQLRHSLKGGERSRGSAQLEWAFPLRGALHGWLQLFSGQGESLVDYNLRQNKIGIGVTIAGWR